MTPRRRFLLTAYGSRGDVQPLFALALALRAAGHDALVAAPANFSTFAASLGVPFRAVGSDIDRFFADSRLGLARMVAALRSELGAHVEALAEAASGCVAVVGAGVPVAAPTAAELHGIPYIFVAYAPVVLPSRHHPPPAVGAQSLPAWSNAALWSATRALLDGAARGELNRVRRARGLGPIRALYSHVVGLRPLLAADATLAPPAPDQDCVTTGAWQLPEDPLAPALSAFLDAGDAPFYLGFGSMPDADPRATQQLVVEATRTLGRRAVVLSALDHGWPAQAHAVRAAPHGRLFPRCAAVVHHGGAGTTHAAARAGVPQVVVPHALDQRWWAHRVRVLGLGAAPLARAKLSARSLGHALEEALGPDVAARAKSFAAGLTNDGVERAIPELLARAASRSALEGKCRA